MRFGAFLAIIGFGSSLLHFTDVQFRLVLWAEPWQPLLGLGIGAVGSVICWIAYAFRQRRAASAAPGTGYPQPPAQQFAPPPQFAGPPPQPFGPPQPLQPYPPQYQAPYQPRYPQHGPPPGYPYRQPPR